MARLQEKFQSELAGEIQKKLGLKNPMQVPRITKITLNMGVGEAVADKKIMEKARNDMEKISGQRPVTTLARKSVAGFKIRDGMAIGCKVTLRRERMYEFLDRLVNVAIPRIRDFRGLNPKSFDRQGNYSMVQLECAEPAIADFEQFLALAPDAGDAQQLKQQIALLRAHSSTVH